MAGDDVVKKYVSAKELKETLYKEEDVEVDGKLFRIKRLSPLDFMDMEQIPKLFELAAEAAVKKVSVEELAKEKVKDSPADMIKLIREGENILIRGMIFPKVVREEVADSTEEVVPVSFFSNDLSLLMILVTRISMLMVGGVKAPFQDKPKQGPADLSNGEPVPPVAQ